MKTVITVQHTQSQHHINGMIGSWTDWDLSEIGVQQAQRIAQRLAPVVKDQEWCMYTSNLLRSKHTAEIIAETLNLHPLVTGALRERNLGSAVGKSVQWFRENMQRQEHSVYDRFFDDAESRKDVWDRLLPFVNEIITSGDSNVILVSHGDTLSILNAIWLGMDADDLNRCDLSGLAGGVSFLYLKDDGKRVIRRLSDMSFVAE
ncbi:putative phosphoglycerate mutase [Methanomicrobium sp. W14]|uniref:histidine phosphatase family protein n=1 Tax=Methanomicrobium sp. W14 TaxID=2817839 RepID=UPI001AE72EEA|nr:putative phosphoglycerate mutase [Methanomicrobium sp. W14]